MIVRGGGGGVKKGGVDVSESGCNFFFEVCTVEFSFFATLFLLLLLLLFLFYFLFYTLKRKGENRKELEKKGKRR